MRILIAFDGSTWATEAVALAAAAAWPAGSQVRIVSVVDQSMSAPSLPRSPMISTPVLELELADYLESEHAKIVEQFAHLGAESEILYGRPGTMIIDDARAFGADLVMIGSRGHGPIASLVLGSVSAEVVDHAPCPVLVARHGSVKRAVFATDGSPPARAAEELIGDWPMFEGRPIDVISIAEAVRPLTSGIAPMLQSQVREAHAQDLRTATEAAERVASEAADRLRATRRDADHTVGRGDAAAEIIAIAEARGADLIVLGSRGRSAIVEIVLGSVARNVLAGSKASVLIVRHTTSDPAGG